MSNQDDPLYRRFLRLLADVDYETATAILALCQEWVSLQHALQVLTREAAVAEACQIMGCLPGPEVADTN